jgi:predicted MFS family arabinose efflux permease
MRVPVGIGMIRQTLTLRNYRLYVIGNMSSNVGMWAQRVAIGWLTWELTQSTAWLGIMALAESGPTILLGLVAGTVVDRVDQFKLLRMTQFFSMLYSIALAFFTLSGLINIWLLMILVLLRGGVVAFNRPTRMTVVYGLVGRDLLPSALAMNAMIFNSSRFLGPALGGAIIAWFGTGWTFVAAAGLFFVFTLSLRSMEVADIALEPPPLVKRSMWVETVEGVRYILRHDGIRTQLAILIVTSIFAKPLSDLLPGFAADVFGRGSSGLAMLLSFHGAGAMLGAMWMSARGELRGLTRISLANILLMAIALVLFVASDQFWFACPVAGLIGFAFIVQSVSNQTLIQSAVESNFRGRVLSIYGMINQGVPALGTMAIGGAAERYGLRLPVLAGALVAAALFVWAWRIRQPMAAALEDAARPVVPRPSAEQL